MKKKTPVNKQPKPFWLIDAIESDTSIEYDEQIKDAPILNDFLKSLNYTKENLFRDPDSNPDLVEKEYKKLIYIINRIFSYFPDTIFQAQEMNMRSLLPPKAHYEYLLMTLSKQKRYAGKIKIDKPDDLEIVKKYYDYSDKKARKALEILSEDDIRNIKTYFYEGGLGRKKK